MVTLNEQLDALRPQLALLRSANNERDLVQALRTRSRRLEGARLALEKTLDDLGMVERLTGRSGARPRASAQLRAKPRALGQQLVEADNNIIDNTQWDRSFLTPLEVYTDKVAQVALQEWQAFVDEKAATVPDEVLDQFERSGLGMTVRQVREARDEILRLRARLPTGDAAPTVVLELAKKISAALSDLKSIPDAVRVFIARAARREAVVEDLTDEVREWLKSKDMLKQVRLGFS